MPQARGGQRKGRQTRAARTLPQLRARAKDVGGPAEWDRPVPQPGDAPRPEATSHQPRVVEPER
eukprot:15446684-Alexandrium_andersonii.AAC.1